LFEACPLDIAPEQERNVFMAPNPINDPGHWRKLAQEMRVLAESVTDSAAKETILRIGRDYDRLAQRVMRKSDDQPKPH
jgi:hypothetical protein